MVRLGLGYGINSGAKISNVSAPPVVPPVAPLDLYIMAGQSNMHGHALLSNLSSSQTATQTGVNFFTSWHENTSNATTTQYNSGWSSDLVPGETRGQGTSSSITTTMFGPELSFASKATSLGLVSSGRELAILKYAVGASTSFANGNEGSSDLSDWDTTVTAEAPYTFTIASHSLSGSFNGAIGDWEYNPGMGRYEQIGDPSHYNLIYKAYTSSTAYYWRLDTNGNTMNISTGEDLFDTFSSSFTVTNKVRYDARDGDCWVGFKQAIDDAVSALGGRSAEFKGFLWYQGESDGANQTPTERISEKLTKLFQDTYSYLTDEHGFTTSVGGVPKPVIITAPCAQSAQKLAWEDSYEHLRDRTNGGLVLARDYHGGQADVHLLGQDMWDLGEAMAESMYNVQRSASLFDVSTLTNKFWLDANDSSTITKVTYTNTVSEVADKANSQDLDAVGQPQVITLPLSKQAIDFDSDAEYLEAKANMTHIDDVKQTWYLVMNPSGVNGNQDSAWSADNYKMSYLPGSNSQFWGQWYHVPGGGATQGYVGRRTSATDTGGSINIHEIEWDPVNNVVNQWFNGEPVTGTLISGQATAVRLAGMGKFRFNAQYGPNVLGKLDGILCEAICTSDNLPTNREKIQGYLAHKWDIEYKLPKTHTYRYLAPT